MPKAEALQAKKQLKGNSLPPALSTRSNNVPSSVIARSNFRHIIITRSNVKYIIP